MDLEDLEEVVEIIEASENVQVIQPDEVAAVVYASVVHKSKEEEPILVEQVIEGIFLYRKKCFLLEMANFSY